MASSPAFTPRRPKARSGIFVSYRRQDCAGSAGRLADSLRTRFRSEIFRDVEAIEPGADFGDAIERALASCAVLLAVIGPGWLTATDESGARRLDDAGDVTRLEIAIALRAAPKVCVIPVLVDGATLPRPDELPDDLAALPRHQACELSDARWAFDFRQLARAIEKALPPRISPRVSAAACAVLVALASALVASYAPAARAGLPRPVFVALVAAAGLGGAALLERALRRCGRRPRPALRGAAAVALPLALTAAGWLLSGDLRLTVRVADVDGHAVGRGQLRLDLGRASWTRSIPPGGVVVFERIPRYLRSEEVSLSPEVPELEPAERPPRPFPDGGVLTLRLRPVPTPLTEVVGLVVSDDGRPVAGAVVELGGGVRVVTGADGRFRAALDRPPRSVVHVVVRHGGRVRHEDDYTIPNDLTLRFRR